jgi:hypothetical protein
MATARAPRLALSLGVLLISVTARAEIVELKLEAPEPFAAGQAFGAAGAYVRIKGIARGELDPKTVANRVIADIDKAPLNASTRPMYSCCARLIPRKATGCCSTR